MSNNQINNSAVHASPANQSKKPKFETWLSVYHIFMSITDAVLSSPEGIDHEQARININHCVDTLYKAHEGNPAWDFAYERWIEPSDDDEEVLV